MLAGAWCSGDGWRRSGRAWGIDLEVTADLSEQTSWDRHKRRWEGVLEISRYWSWPSPPSQRHGPATRPPEGTAPIGAVRAGDQGPPRSRRRFHTRRSAAGGGLGHIQRLAPGQGRHLGTILDCQSAADRGPGAGPGSHLRPPPDQAERNIHAQFRAYRATLRKAIRSGRLEALEGV
jgi:hypothetical protein